MKRYEDSTSLMQEVGYFSRLTVSVGRLGTERALGRAISDQEAMTYGKRRITAIAAPLVVASALVGLDNLYDVQQEHIDKLEICVEERAGRPVELQVDPKGDRLIQPASIYGYIETCLDELNQEP